MSESKIKLKYLARFFIYVSFMMLFGLAYFGFNKAVTIYATIWFIIGIGFIVIELVKLGVDKIVEDKPKN